MNDDLVADFLRRIGPLPKEQLLQLEIELRGAFGGRSWYVRKSDGTPRIEADRGSTKGRQR